MICPNLIYDFFLLQCEKYCLQNIISHFMQVCSSVAPTPWSFTALVGWRGVMPPSGYT